MNCLLKLFIFLFIFSNNFIQDTLCSTQSNIQQIHISLTGNPGQTQITWTTNYSDNNYGILYGKIIHNKCNLDFKEENNIKINKFNNNGLSLNGRITYLHYGLLNNLMPSTNYCYKIYNSNETSETYSFKMYDYKKSKTNIIVYGDLDTLNQKTILNVKKTILDYNVDFILHNGDMAYDLYENNGTTGDIFMNQIQRISAQHHYMTSVGNHERMYNFSHYKNRFYNSMLVFNRSSNYFWTLEINNTKIISINTDLYYDSMGVPVKFSDLNSSIGSVITQFNWLSNELLNYRTNPLTQNNWIIVFGHHPLYCSNINHAKLVSTCEGYRNQTYIMRNGWTKYRYASLEDLFFKYKVNMYISSHVHAYERLYPTIFYKKMQTNYIDPPCYVHIMTGNAGRLGDMDNFTNKKDFSAFQLSGNISKGYGMLSIINNTNINWKQFDNKHRKIVDEIDIRRNV